VVVTVGKGVTVSVGQIGVTVGVEVEVGDVVRVGMRVGVCTTVTVGGREVGVRVDVAVGVTVGGTGVAVGVAVGGAGVSLGRAVGSPGGFAVPVSATA
jgi:hypothetical protein